MKLLLICLAVALTTCNASSKKHPCDDVVCRAGRECVDVGGVGECLCVVSCPDHFRPICGSDGETYDSHCKLHQHACISGTHISVEHKGFCKKVFKTQREKDAGHSKLTKIELQREIENDLVSDFHAMEKKQDKAAKKTHKPAVCFSTQRDALRFLLIKYWEDNLKQQPWHTRGMTYRESLWGWFLSCDSSKDNKLNAGELLSCADKVDFFARPEQNPQLTKALCMDAILDDGDQNKDWTLSFEEFTRIMARNYFPKEKKCSLEGKRYKDGAEVDVDCNHCICALGSWVCAASCLKDKDGSKTHPKDLFGYLDVVDNAIDNEDTKAISLRTEKTTKKVPEQLETEDEDPEDELEMDDYYDDLLFETTKNKNLKKKKVELEKALKEIKALKKKTQILSQMWKKQFDKDIEEEEHPQQLKFLKKRNFKKSKSKYNKSKKYAKAQKIFEKSEKQNKKHKKWHFKNY